MDLKTLKLFAGLAFLAFAGGAFLFPGDKTRAQSGKTDEQRGAILEKVASYKLWKRVQRPEPALTNLLGSDAVSIVDSTAMG